MTSGAVFWAPLGPRASRPQALTWGEIRWASPRVIPANPGIQGLHDAPLDPVGTRRAAARDTRFRGDDKGRRLRPISKAASDAFQPPSLISASAARVEWDAMAIAERAGRVAACRLVDLLADLALRGVTAAIRAIGSTGAYGPTGSISIRPRAP